MQRLGKTILISSHILSELGEFCNKLGIIERGKLLVSGTIDDLMDRARAHPVITVEVVGPPEPAALALRDDPRVDKVEQRGEQLFVTLHDPGLHHHFLVPSPDHVAHVVPGWQLPFGLTAVLLGLSEAAGAGVGAWLLRAQPRLEVL